MQTGMQPMMMQQPGMQQQQPIAMQPGMMQQQPGMMQQQPMMMQQPMAQPGVVNTHHNTTNVTVV